MLSALSKLAYVRKILRAMSYSPTEDLKQTLKKLPTKRVAAGAALAGGAMLTNEGINNTREYYRGFGPRSM